MTIKELKETSTTYKNNINNWIFWGAAYDGDKDFIALTIEKHERESTKNYNQRVKEAYVFNFAAMIIDLFNYYLTEKSPVRDMPSELVNDEQWKMFSKDCDLFGTNFETYLNEIQKVASTFGSVGVLVDKPRKKSIGDAAVSKADEINEGIYPYCATYTLPDILDWRIEKNESGRPVLGYLKLKNSDDTYTIWTLTNWEIWEIPTDEKLKTMSNAKPQLVDSGANSLGEIPFVFMINVRDVKKPYQGKSDIKDIARVCGSIVRNCSHGDEVIKFAGFPIYLEPMRPAGEEDGDDKAIGVTAVSEYDPESNAKPEWLESEVLDPITACIAWIDRKISAIYDMAHISGIHATATSKEARSGVSLRYEFQQLASILSKKSDNMNEAELKIIYLYLKWQLMESLFKQINVHRPKDFSIDDLSQDLDNILKVLERDTKRVARNMGVEYMKSAKKRMVKHTLPDITETVRTEIFSEIDAMTEMDPLVQVEPSILPSGETAPIEKEEPGEVKE